MFNTIFDPKQQLRSCRSKLCASRQKVNKMEIYLKKLTNDLLEVCRMLDDKPEAKNRLSEIAVDVSFLPDVGYGFDKWTTETPTEPGWYWALNPGDVGGRGVVGLVRIHKSAIDGELSLAFHGSDMSYYLPYKFISHWLGPLPEPKVPELKELKGSR